MDDAIRLALALGAGMLLGTVFFAGLWWTVQRGLNSANPALWFGASMLARTALVLGGFYLAGGADWKRLLLCLLGFLAARAIVTRRIRQREACHAS